MEKRVTRRGDRAFFKRASRSLVGGVDSPVRAFRYVDGTPIALQRGKGSKVYDRKGNEYIDYVLAWGAVLLGHAHPSVVKEVKEAIASGAGFGATHESELALAELIKEAVPFIERVRFTSSGTEAVMGAIRLARGYTKRDKVLKFEHAYHGHADYLLARSGSGLATLNIASSGGVPEDFIKHTLIAPLGDKRAIREVFDKYGDEIAAVIIEPVGANYGVIPPDVGFLEHIRSLTKRHGAFLIFDEVVTGFRFSFGTAAERLGVRPDLITLGKVIGGGLPIGAYGGSAKIMERLAPLGDVYQASTFAGNPVCAKAGLATLKILQKSEHEYARIAELGRSLSAGIAEQATQRGIKTRVTHYGTIFSLKFEERAIFKRFYTEMLEGGIYLAPSEFEANFLSFAHTKKDIADTLERAISAFERAGRDKR